MKRQFTEKQLVAAHKRMFEDYHRFKDMTGRYNAGKLEGEVFTLYKIKDGRIITKFNVNTFLPVN